MTEHDIQGFRNVKLPEGAALRRKETLEYITPEMAYDVELFENQDGTFYAIAVPRDSERLIVYGTNYLESVEMTLQVLIQKIQREAF